MGIDQTIICIACGQPFVWRAVHHAFFKRRGWSAPKRCDGCAAAARRQHGQAPRRERDHAKEE
jgi:hypothetical protein